jgi:hypothetical protein
MVPISPTLASQFLTHGDGHLLRPCSHRRRQVEGSEPYTLKSQVPRAKPPQGQLLPMPASTISVFAKTTESELALSFDRKAPYKQPIKHRVSKKVDGFDDDIEVANDRPSKPSDFHGQPAQTRVRFDKSVNMDTMYESVKVRDAQEPKLKLPALAVPKDFKEASEYAVTGAVERLDTLPQFLRDLSTEPERLEAREVERVTPYVTSMVLYTKYREFLAHGRGFHYRSISCR